MGVVGSQTRLDRVSMKTVKAVGGSVVGEREQGWGNAGKLGFSGSPRGIRAR